MESYKTWSGPFSLFIPFVSIVPFVFDNLYGKFVNHTCFHFPNRNGLVHELISKSALARRKRCTKHDIRKLDTFLRNVNAAETDSNSCTTFYIYDHLYKIFVMLLTFMFEKRSSFACGIWFIPSIVKSWCLLTVTYFSGLWVQPAMTHLPLQTLTFFHKT